MHAQDVLNRGESLLDWALKETTGDVKKDAAFADPSYGTTELSLPFCLPPPALCPPPDCGLPIRMPLRVQLANIGAANRG